MNFINKIFSLEEMSSAQVAINLCQDNNFKEIAMFLEKPTYGIFVTQEMGHMALLHPANRVDSFVSDPKKLDEWAYMIKDSWSMDAFLRDCSFNNAERVQLWDAAIEKQCQRLVNGIPNLLRQRVYIWINRIALEYLSYSRRMEVLFGVSRYFLMSVLTPEDWTKAGQLDERRLALKLLQDERLADLQRYRIACVYCLYEHIPQLWTRLTQEEKEFTSWKPGTDLSKETNDLVLLWSRHMYREQEETAESQTHHPWGNAAYKAIFYGIRSGVMLCWEKLKEHITQMMVFDMALLSLQKWQSMLKMQDHVSYKENLVSNSPRTVGAVENYNLPVYYTDLLGFFLSQMDEEQQLTFFKTSFKSSHTDRIMECFLDWPHHDYFLPTMNRIWGVIPKDNYGRVLLTLVIKYSGEDEKINSFCDYQNLIGMLWEMTPEDYKRSSFTDYKSTNSFQVNIGKLLSRLLKRKPFQEKDELLFKYFIRDQTQERRMGLIPSEAGEYILLQLFRKEKWSLANWFLEACLAKEEIPNFKKRFIHSPSIFHFCKVEFEQDHQRLVEDIINWSFDLDSDKEHFKCALISSLDDSSTWGNLLNVERFPRMNRIIYFLSSSEQKRKLYRLCFASNACKSLIGKRAEEQINLILHWCLESDEEIRDLKKHIFEYRGICPI